MYSYQNICRMCHRETGKLVSPCACQGSMKFVHSRCLTEWVARHGHLKCEVCGATYSVAKVLKEGNDKLLQRNYFFLLIFCIRRYLRQNANFLLKVALCVLTFVLTPLVLGLFQHAVKPFVSSAFSWHYTGSFLDVGTDFALVPALASGVRLTIVAAPLFFFSEAWCDWFASHEDTLFNDYLPETTGAGGTERLSAMDSEEDIDDGEENQKLLPVFLPDESGAVLEAIAAAQLQSNRMLGIQQRKASFAIFFSGIRFIFFYVFLVMVLDIFPEMLHVLLRYLWNSVSGNGHIASAAESLLLQTSASDGVALRRMSVIRGLVEAVTSSTILSLMYLHMRILFSFLIAFSISKRKYIMTQCKRVLLTLIHLRGLLNFLMLICYVLPAVTLLTTFLCLDFFESEVLFDVEDRQQKAWYILTKSNMKYSMQSHGGAETSSPVSVLKALYIISKSNDSDICWNFGESINNTSSVVVDDADDALLFPIFTLTKLFSQLDSLVLTAMSYVGVLIGVFVYYQVLTLSSKLPREWTERSVLCRVLHCGFLQLIALLDGKTLFILLFEILALTCFVSIVVVRYSFMLVGYLDPTVVPIVLLVNSNRWVRVMYFVNPVPIEGFILHEALRALHGRLTRKIGDIFDVHTAQEVRELQSVSHILSITVRWVAFTFSYWVFTFSLMSIYMIPVLYMISKRFAIARTLVFIILNTCTCIRVAFPHAFPITQAKVKEVMAQVHLCICICKCQWWIRSSLALSVKKRPDLGERGARLFSVEPLEYMPGEIEYSIFSALRILYKQVEKKLLNQYEENIPSLERIKKVLSQRLTRQPINDFLFEDDILLLAEMVENPSVLQVSKFLLSCCLLCGILPCLAGSAFIALVRNTVLSTPCCYTGPLFPLLIFMWVSGVLLTAMLLSLKSMKTNFSGHVAILFYCGCHHLSTRNSFVNCIAPVFLRIGCFTFVPYTFSIVSNLLFATWRASSLGFFLLSIGILSTWSAKGYRMVNMKKFAGDIYKRSGLPHIGNQVSQVDIASRNESRRIYTKVSEGNEVTLRTSSISNEAGHTRRNLQREGHSLRMIADCGAQWLKRKLVTLKETLFQLEESSREILLNIAERENVNGIVFIDR